MKTQLTELSIKAIKAPVSGQAEYFDVAPSGFGLRVSYKGTKTFFLAKRVAGRMVRFSLGKFPAKGLKEARVAAIQLIDQIADGTDPRVQVREGKRKVEATHASTYGAVVDRFFKEHVTPKLRKATETSYTFALKRAATAKWLDWPVTSVAKADVKAVISRYEFDGHQATARLVQAHLKKFFNWCVEEDVLTASPMVGVKAVKPTKRTRFLKLVELQRVWDGLSCLDAPNQGLIKVLILTGQRIGETRQMRWQDLEDLDGKQPRWNIPETVTKNKKPHVVPLAHAVVAIIKAQPTFQDCDYVFTHGVTALGTGGKNKEMLDKHLGEPALDFVWHDIRHSFVTELNERRIALPHIIEAVINHISGSRGGIAGHYNHAVYLPERRKALEDWAKIVLAKK